MPVTVSSDIDTLVFRDWDTRRVGDLFIQGQGLSGWYGSVKVRESGSDIPQQDGVRFPSRLTTAGRPITMPIGILGDDDIRNGQYIDRINDLQERELTFTVDDLWGRRHCNQTILTADPEPTMNNNAVSWLATLVFYAFDPLKYGDTQTIKGANGIIPVSNPGYAPSYPRFSIRQHVTRLDLNYNGFAVTWLGDTNSLDIDLSSMKANTGALFGEAFKIQRHNTFIRYTGVNNITLQYEPAWR